MGRIIDKSLAKNTPCSGYIDLDTEEKILWSSGSIGPLLDKQEDTYCTDKTTRPLTTEQKETQHNMKKAVEKCKDKTNYLNCMSNELEEKQELNWGE